MTVALWARPEAAVWAPFVAPVGYPGNEFIGPYITVPLAVPLVVFRIGHCG
jgi:hypothetical protein